MKLKLRHRLNGAILITFVFIVVIFIAIQIPFQKQKMDRGISRRISLLSTLINQEVEVLNKEMKAKNIEELRHYLQHMITVEGILAISIFDNNGVGIVSNSLEGIPVQTELDPQIVYANGYHALEQWQNKEALFYVKALDTELGERIGFVSVYYSIEDLVWEQHSSLILFSLFLVVILGIMLLVLNWILHYSIIGPIKCLRDSIKDVYVGEVEDGCLIKQDGDEITNLSDAFQEIIKDLSVSYIQLNKRNQELNESIKKREDLLQALKEKQGALSKEVDDRQQANKILWKLQKLLFAVVEQSPFSIMIGEAPDCNIILLNEEAERLNGQPREEQLTFSLSNQDAVKFEMYDENGKIDTVDLPLPKAVFHGLVTKNKEIIVRRDDGSESWILCNAAPIFNEQKEIIAGVVTYSDITELKEASEEKKVLEERLHQSEKLQAIGQLAGGVAHDFNNQLAGIMGFADLLKNCLKEQDLIDYADNIIQATKRAENLTSQLLLFARKGRNKNVVVDINQIIDEVIGLLKHSLDKNITIQKNLDKQGLLIHGDPSQMQNALLNLAINARDAMPRGGVLSLTSEKVALDEVFCNNSVINISPGYYVKICIVDTGSGIDDDVRRQMFDPFFTTKKAGKGTGMGLSMVYGTIKNHDGTLEVISEEDKGTTIEVYFPLAEEAVSGEEQVAPELLSGKETIMVVDDESAFRNMANSMLTQLGYNVILCKDGLDAFERYRQIHKDVDLVLIDMIMPQMNGRDAFLGMHDINPDIKAILSSGYRKNTETQTVLDLGIQGFIQKPFRMADLSKVVREVLDEGVVH